MNLTSAFCPLFFHRRSLFIVLGLVSEHNSGAVAIFVLLQPHLLQPRHRAGLHAGHQFYLAIERRESTES